jgi:hypothetical protein
MPLGDSQDAALAGAGLLAAGELAAWSLDVRGGRPEPAAAAARAAGLRAALKLTLALGRRLQHPS